MLLALASRQTNMFKQLFILWMSTKIATLVLKLQIDEHFVCFISPMSRLIVGRLHLVAVLIINLWNIIQPTCSPHSWLPYLSFSCQACSWWSPETGLASCCSWSKESRTQTCPCPTSGWADPWCTQICRFRKLLRGGMACRAPRTSSWGGSTWKYPPSKWSVTWAIFVR